MEINKELKHIAEYQNSILPRHQKRTEEAVEIIANDAIESLKMEHLTSNRFCIWI